jgi:hypothetical protein
MLIVTALQFSHPMPFIVLVITRDRLQHHVIHHLLILPRKAEQGLLGTFILFAGTSAEVGVSGWLPG